MEEIVLALRRSVASFARARILFYILVPALIAVGCVIGLATALLDQLVQGLQQQPPMSWLVAWGALWLAHLLAALGGWLAIMSAGYLIGMLLTAILVLPLMVDLLAATDYDDLARLGRDNVLLSTWNSVWAAILFVIGWLITLPLWLIPGAGLLLPLFWIAWLNRRTFTYDVLAAHVTADEWRQLRRQQAWPLLALGLIMAALTHVPLLGMLAPSLAALAYVHFCLEALRRLRRGAVTSISAAADAA